MNGTAYQLQPGDMLDAIAGEVLAKGHAARPRPCAFTGPARVIDVWCTALQREYLHVLVDQPVGGHYVVRRTAPVAYRRAA